MKIQPPETQKLNGDSDRAVKQATACQTSLSRYRAVSEHLCCELNGESVILSLRNGKYYGLNSVGSRIWELVQTPLTTVEIETVILREYDVESEVCRRQVSEFLDHMVSEELIEIVHETVVEIS